VDYDTSPSTDVKKFPTELYAGIILHTGNWESNFLIFLASIYKCLFVSPQLIARGNYNQIFYRESNCTI